MAKQTGQFQYTTDGFFSNKNSDAVKKINNTYQISTRTFGAGQMVLGGIGVAGSVVTAPASCVTGVGCVANLFVGTVSLDAAYAGSKQLISGKSENTFMNQGLQGLGMSSQAASLVEMALGVGSAATALKVANRSVDQAIALSKLSSTGGQSVVAGTQKSTPTTAEIPTSLRPLANGPTEEQLKAVNLAAKELQAGKNLPGVSKIVGETNSAEIIGAANGLGRPNLINPGGRMDNYTACVTANISNKIEGRAIDNLMTAQQVEAKWGNTGANMNLSEAQSLAYVERATGTVGFKTPMLAPDAPVGHYSVFGTSIENGRGHIMYGQVLPDGRAYFYDPQIGGGTKTYDYLSTIYKNMRTYHMGPE